MRLPPLDHHPLPNPNRHRHEPHWHPARRFLHGAIPGALHGWLLDPGSLTRRVRGACDGRFGVRLLGQGRQRPQLEEALALAMSPTAGALVRQVQLLCGTTPWVFARTVIPHSTLCGPRRRLGRLGDRPLGAALFADPTMRRGEVEVARLTPRHPLYHAAVAGLAAPPPEVWGRRSLFWLQGAPLLVSEFFLPGLPRPGEEGR